MEGPRLAHRIRDRVSAALLATAVGRRKTLTVYRISLSSNYPSSVKFINVKWRREKFERRDWILARKRCSSMPKGRQGKGGRGKVAATEKKKERAVRRALRRERAGGAYLQPGDPDFRSFSNQLAVQGLRLEDVPADG